MDRIKQILGGSSSEESVDGDVISKMNLVSKSKMLPTGDINEILNINEQFTRERNNSKIYRIITSITPLITNVLTNTTGVNSLANFSTLEFRDTGTISLGGEILTFRESLETKLIEKNGWLGYINPNIGETGLCEFVDLEPSRDKFFYLSSEENTNWLTYVTYPSESVSEPGDITYGGLLVVDKDDVTVGGRDVIAFGVPIKHGLSAGDNVQISNLSSTLDGVYEVLRVGLDNGDLAENYFCVNIQQSALPLLPTDVRFSRLVGEEPSSYYFRKFTKIKTINGDTIDTKDSEFYRLGFAQTIYEDSLGQVSFTEDLSVEGLLDNLGRPITELYYTIVKDTKHNGEEFFSNIKSGLKMEFITGIEDNLLIPDINRIHNGVSTPVQSHIPLEMGIDETIDSFFGDVVEYNRFELREKSLATVRHRFNTLNRENGGSIIVDNETLDLGVRQEGYTYTPFYKMKIREFSNYIEQGDLNTVGIPDYATDLNDGRFIWRDLLDVGTTDTQSTEALYPFLNNAHYIHKNINHVLNRQDPFGNYNLLYTQFPRDMFGDRNERLFEVKNTQDVC